MIRSRLQDRKIVHLTFEEGTFVESMSISFKIQLFKTMWKCAVTVLQNCQKIWNQYKITFYDWSMYHPWFRFLELVVKSYQVVLSWCEFHWTQSVSGDYHTLYVFTNQLVQFLFNFCPGTWTIWVSCSRTVIDQKKPQNLFEQVHKTGSWPREQGICSTCSNLTWKLFIMKIQNES